MPIRLLLRSGGRAGETLILAKAYITIGRHPHSDVRFGPDGDFEVSSRHAAIVARDGLWVLRDLGSTNGTFVNGERLRGDHVLSERDIILLGRSGPVIELGEAPHYTPPQYPVTAPPPGYAPPTLTYRPPRPTLASEAPAPGELPHTRDLTAQSRRMRAVLVVGAVALAVLAAGLAWIVTTHAR